MEAGSSYFKTTYPRDEVEKIVMAELEERKTGRGSDGLVRGGEYRCQTKETNGKGTGEGERGKGEHGSKGAPQSTRKVQDEEEEARGEDECREAKFDLRQLEERRRAQEEEEDVA